MAYYGNLALRPERAPEETQQKKASQPQHRSKVVHRKSIPIGEKLLYLFTIGVVVLVAGFIIFRYAQIYQINAQIQETNRQYEQTTEKMKEQQRQVDLLSDQKRIKDKALAMGMVPIDSDAINVTSKDGHDIVAMKP